MAKTGMMFFEEYFDYMDDMTPEQYYQFMGLIRDLRYNGVDTDANMVEDKIVRLAWRAVRPSVMKSLANAKHYGEKKGKGKEDQPPAQVSVYTPKEKQDKNIPPMEAWMDELSGMTVEPVRALRMNELCHKYGYPYEEMLSMYQQYKQNKAVIYG